MSNHNKPILDPAGTGKNSPGNDTALSRVLNHPKYRRNYLTPEELALKECAIHIMQALITEGFFRDLKSDDPRVERFDITAEAVEELQYNYHRALVVSRSMLSELAPDVPDSFIGEALDLLSDAVCTYTPHGLRTQHGKVFSVVDENPQETSSQFGQTQYGLAFPFYINHDDDELWEDDQTQQEAADDMTRADLAQWSVGLPTAIDMVFANRKKGVEPNSFPNRYS